MTVNRRHLVFALLATLAAAFFRFSRLETVPPGLWYDEAVNGIDALRMPGGDLYSNGAYMVMAALAWNLKAWYGLLMPDKKTGAEVVRMEFARFLNGFMALPAQVLNQARQIKVRLLGWTPRVEAFLEMFAWLRSQRFAYRL